MNSIGHLSIQDSYDWLRIMGFLARLALFVTCSDCTPSPISSNPSSPTLASTRNQVEEGGSHSAEDTLESKTDNKTDSKTKNGPEENTSTSVSNLEKQEDPLSTPVVADRLSWSGYSFELQEFKEHCEIRWTQDSAAIDSVTTKPALLELSPPCRFVRRDGQILSYRYPKQAVDGIVLISGTPPTPAIRAQWNLDRLGARGLDCGDKTQAMILRKGKIEVSSKVVDGMIVCPQIGVDEHLFADFAGVPPGR